MCNEIKIEKSELNIVHVFDVPHSLLFSMWTEPEHLFPTEQLTVFLFQETLPLTCSNWQITIIVFLEDYLSSL
ncbi:hypothetical protein BAGA_19420 [Bacillus gaemokensis]|uniref:Uncharacterized protein n=1 Tax=Bacillus gaemokensis TaxID=574375 RepID=A0A073KJG4_9BACI|nr:hypothetical protein BAGA_19420 [Bacillus gaemokensis]KYG25887.1 hypothetical protein AZF08_17830 [Bacillus gaemokensis]